jgi:hypothetical protein
MGIGGPSGWTLALSVDLYFNLKWRVWIKQMDGNEGSTVSITTPGYVTQCSAQVIRFSGGNAGTVEGTSWDIEYLSATGYGTTINPPSTTASWGSTTNTWVALACAAGLSPSVTGYPSGYSNGAAATAGGTVMSATKAATAATDDPNSFTIGTSSNYRAATLVLRGSTPVYAGAGVASGSGTARAPTITPPTVRAYADTAAAATGTAYYVRTPRVQVPSNLVIEWDLDNDGDFSTATETVTPYVLGGDLRVGRDYPSQVTGRTTPGQLRITFDNKDDRFNYFNTASPYNTAPYDLKTGRLIRVRTSESAPDDPVLLARHKFRTLGPLGDDELGNTWTIPAGNFTIFDGTAEAVGPASSSGHVNIAYLDLGTEDYYAQVIIPQKDAINRVGMVFHYTDVNNMCYLYLGDGVIYIYKVVGGTHTALAHDGAENRDHIALGLQVHDSTIKAYIDGIEVLSTTVSGVTLTSNVGLYGRWYYQRPPKFTEFFAWNRSRIIQSWDTQTTNDGVLGTFRVTSVRPRVQGKVKTCEVTAVGDLGLLDRPVTPPASTGPNPTQSYGSKAGQLIGNVLSRIGLLHPPGPIDAGVITLGSVGMDRQQAISVVRALEATEVGMVYELPCGGIGFEDRDARLDSTVTATFTDDPAVQGYTIEEIEQRDWQGDIINQVTNEVSASLPLNVWWESQYGNNSPGTLDIDIVLPDAATDGAQAGDLLIVAIASTIYTQNVTWITPPGWVALRQLGDDRGKQRIFAKKLTQSDLGTTVTFYEGSAAGAFQAMLSLVRPWYGNIVNGVAISEHTGYGGPSGSTESIAGFNDPPVLFTPWPISPTLFLVYRAGMESTSGGSVSTSSDDQAPNGFDTHIAVFIDAAAGGPAYDCAQSFARRIRTEQIINPTPFGGTFTGFNYVEACTVAVRGYLGDDPPATGGQAIVNTNTESQNDRAAVLEHPFPGRFYEHEDAANTAANQLLARYADDRPIVMIGFTATRDARHRLLASNIRISDRIRIDANGNSGLGIDTEFIVETITHTFSNGTTLWRTLLDCSPATDAAAGADNYTARIRAGAVTGSGTANDPTINTTSSPNPVPESTTTSATNTPSTSHTITLPGTTVSGELLIAVLMFNSDTTVTGMSGWTRLDNNSASPGQSEVWAKIATGSDGASVSATTSTSQAGAFVVARISGNNGGVVNNTDYTIAKSSAATTANPNPPSVTAAWGSSSALFMAICCVRGDNDTVTGYPASYSNGAYSVTTNGGGGGATAGVAFRALSSATDDPGTFTLSASEYGACYTIVIRPA